MQHRHLASHNAWTYAKIDDILDRGTLADWHVLLGAVEDNLDLAQRVFSLATKTHRYGTSRAWMNVIRAIYPEIPFSD